MTFFVPTLTFGGTRPPTVDEYEQYEVRHRKRLAMRPGLTGMWQVSGRSDIEDLYLQTFLHTLSTYNISNKKPYCRGKTLFEWSMDSLIGYNEYVEKYIFVVRSEDGETEFIRKQCIKYGFENVDIIEE